MARVMIKCPQTGDWVFTGIETDTETFERLPDASAQLQCPQCGLDHVWRKADAELIEGPRTIDSPPKA